MRFHRRIAILGFPGVGKSSLAHHFVYKHFSNEYDPNIKTNLQYQYVLNGKEYDLTIVDNAGSDQYSIIHSDLDNSDAYILVYAIDDLQSFQMVSMIREKILSTSAITRIPMVLVGNKSDRKDERVVSFGDGENLAKQWNIQFVETSAMDFNSAKETFDKSVNAIEDTERLLIENGMTSQNSSKSTDKMNSIPTKPIENVPSRKLQTNQKNCLIS